MYLPQQLTGSLLAHHPTYLRLFDDHGPLVNRMILPPLQFGVELWQDLFCDRDFCF
jgi:hypothetical protein